MEVVQKNRIKGINLVFLITIVISVIASFLPLDFLQDNMVLNVLFSQGILVLPTVIFLVVNKMSYAETVRLRRMRVADMLLALLFGILLNPVMTLINALSMLFSTNLISFSMLNVVQQMPFFCGLFLMAVTPAVVEETVYRGVFYNEYSKIHPLKAALLSGLLFGIMHANINQFCYAAVMGFVFALLIEATGSILSSMLVHFWTNASSVVMMYLYPKIYKVAQSYYNMYKEYGNEAMAAALENSYGDMTRSAEEWMLQALGNGQSPLTFSQVLIMYGPQALIMGVLAFFVYKKLAIRNGNWYRICACFKKQPQIPVAGDAEMQSEIQPKQRMVTVPLVIGILLGVAFMFFNEILLRRAM